MVIDNREMDKGGGATGQSWHNHEADLQTGQRATDPASKGGHGYYCKTTGWRPTCKCPGLDGDHWGSDCAEGRDWPTNPCVVFDPFMGAGTTAVVAIQHGRTYVGTELSAEYAKIAAKRIAAVDTGVPVKEAQKGQGALWK